MKIYLERPIPSDQSFTVEDDFWSHYLNNVRRVKTGDEIEVVGPDSVVTSVVRDTDPLTMEPKSSRQRDEPSYQLTIAQSITRKQKFDDLVRRVSEMGATSILPLISERTVRKPNKPDKQHRRWKRIMLDSTRITNRDWLPEIQPILSLESYLDDRVSDDDTIFWGQPPADSAYDVFEEYSPQRATIVVGPEGGFTEEEKKQLARTGRGVSLGEANYRAETASMILTTLWLQQSGQLD
ncbi:MAG: 16S rRNA (uracil(1498)-N(3))-methyltransferase [bacterium]